MPLVHEVPHEDVARIREGLEVGKETALHIAQEVALLKGARHVELLRQVVPRVRSRGEEGGAGEVAGDLVVLFVVRDGVAAHAAAEDCDLEWGAGGLGGRSRNWFWSDRCRGGRLGRGGRAGGGALDTRLRRYSSSWSWFSRSSLRGCGWRGCVGGHISAAHASIVGRQPWVWW